MTINNYNEYFTTTKIKIIYTSDLQLSQYGFLEHKEFWELRKKDFVVDYTISIRIYKDTKKLSIEVSDFDEFEVIDVTKILENKENISEFLVKNVKNIYNKIWMEICSLTSSLIVNIDDFKYGDFFTKYE